MINDKVRGWLAENRRDQQWLADQLGLHRSTISLSINGRRNWRPAEVHYLAELLGVTTDQLQNSQNHTNVGGAP